jgi:NAD(P)H-nitrite reductase large subunit
MIERASTTIEIDDATLVCRCEEVTAASIRSAIADGATSISDVKRRTRAGMGLCQGIFCTRTVARILHSEAGQLLQTLVPMTARPPARIIPLAALADMDA